MRTWRTIARMVGGSIGPIITVIWSAITFVQERRPMSTLEWVGVALLSASILWGIVELVVFLRGLHTRIEALRASNIESRRTMSNIEGRVTMMEGWWMDPNDIGLIAMRVQKTEKK